MRTQLRALALALAATALTAGAANAAIELQAYSFTATTAGPITNHSGSFVLAYDDVANSYSLKALNFSLGNYAFNTSNAGVVNTGAGFAVGGLAEGVVQTSIAEYDFTILTYNGLNSFGYSVGDNYYLYYSLSPAITRTNLPTTGAVPEPTTWALMILGFGATGAALRRRRLAIA